MASNAITALKPSFKLADAQSVLAIIKNDVLGSPAIDLKLADAALEPNLSFDAAALGITLNMRGGLSVSAFNSPDDIDGDGILAAEAPRDGVLDLPPQLQLSDDSAWLKYRVDAGVKASAGGSLSMIGFDIDSSAGVILSDYRRHPRSQPAREAFVADLSGGARFAAVLEDVEELGAGDALAIQLAGRLKASVTVSWSDIFTGGITTLGGLLGSSAPIAIELKAGASVTATVHVADDFRIVFSRVSDEAWRVGARKATSRSAAGAIAAGVDVRFTNQQQFKRVAQSAFEATLGERLDQVDALLSRGSLDRLPAALKPVARALLKRLGLDEIATTIEQLRERVADVRERVDRAIEEIAKTRIAVGFAYEYNRVSERTNLLQATCDRAALREFHPSLVRGSFEPVIEALSGERPGLTLETYLNQQTLTRTRAWGFTLGLGKWVNVGGRDHSTATRVVRRNVTGQRQESYVALRGYRGDWVGQTFAWNVDFRAEMAGFSVHATPLVAEYEFGWHLVWSAAEKELSKDELSEWLDLAVLWGAVRERDVLDVSDRLGELTGEPCETVVQLQISNDALRSMLARLAASPDAEFAAALAAAMPWRKGNVVRTHVGLRREAYAPLWAHYFEHPDRSPRDLARRAAQHFTDRHFPDLAALEENFRTVRPFTFAGLVDLNGDTRAAFHEFAGGCAALNAGILSGTPNQDTIDRAAAKMTRVFAQSHHVRALGALLTSTASAAGSGVTRSLAVTPKGGDAIVVSST